MFGRAIRRASTLPKSLNSDHDPQYGFHRWQAHLGVLGVAEIKTVPNVPLSNPFVERMIGTVRREFLDDVLFWGAADLETKLGEFQDYYNGFRAHSARAGSVPLPPMEPSTRANLKFYRWRRHCGGLYQTPMAA